MEFKKVVVPTQGIKIVAEDGGRVIGRASLYLIYNDLHKEPYGLLEDVFVDKARRGEKLGTKLLEAIIKEAKVRGCYKLIGTSRNERNKVHEWYEKNGFKKYGMEFRLNF